MANLPVLAQEQAAATHELSTAMTQIEKGAKVARDAAERAGKSTAAAIDLLADSRLDALLAPMVSFYDLPRRLPDILNARNGVVCQLISYS